MHYDLSVYGCRLGDAHSVKDHTPPPPEFTLFSVQPYDIAFVMLLLTAFMQTIVNIITMCVHSSEF